MAKVNHKSKTAPVTQLDLFNKEATELFLPSERVRWSYSKMNLVRECLRRFYYQYYGSKKKQAPREPDKEKLLFLAQLKDEHLITGEIVHKVIQANLYGAKSGYDWDEKRTLQFGHKLLNDVLQGSLTYQRSESASPASQGILKDIYYGTAAAPVITKRMRDKVQECLLHFFRAPVFKEVKRGARHASSIIEGNINFPLTGQVRIEGKVDLAFHWGPAYFINDWKTGKRSSDDTSLQLLAYALWASEKQAVDLPSIRIQKAYLQDEWIDSLEFSPLHLERAKARILQDAEVLQELDGFGKEGVREAFTKCNQEKLCRKCPFQEVCVASI